MPTFLNEAYGNPIFENYYNTISSNQSSGSSNSIRDNSINNNINNNIEDTFLYNNNPTLQHNCNTDINNILSCNECKEKLKRVLCNDNDIIKNYEYINISGFKLSYSLIIIFILIIITIFLFIDIILKIILHYNTNFLLTTLNK